jgi:hypothetical protein
MKTTLKQDIREHFEVIARRYPETDPLTVDMLVTFFTNKAMDSNCQYLLEDLSDFEQILMD